MARFKKGSAQAKAWGARMRRLRNSKSKKTTRRVATQTKITRRRMVKRYRKKRSSGRRGMSILGINLTKAGSAMAYGAIREKMSNVLMPYTSKIPLGVISDEVGMLGASWALKKFFFKGKGFARDALSIGQGIELARIGEAVINGQVNLGGLFNNAMPATNGGAFSG